jgi:putative DNA primase/helicase
MSTENQSENTLNKNLIRTEEIPASKNPEYAIARRVVDGEINKSFVYCLEQGKFYIYIDGYWQELHELDLRGMLEEEVPEIINKSVQMRNQIIENMKSMVRKKLCDFNNLNLLNLNNYMIDPVGVNVLDHSESHYSTIRVPYKYDSLATCELWEKTLNDIFEGSINKINVLQEFFGYCLTRDTSQEKALLLLGESRSGKSTILHTLRHVVGVNNCSSVPLKYIFNCEHVTRMINTLVNIDTDVSQKATEFEQEFKTITSGEPVQAKILYENSFTFNPFCKLVLAANIFPKITDHSSAFYKRLILLPCERIFLDHEQNKNLKNDLLKELPGILNWSMAGLKKLRSRGRFEVYDFMIEAIQELEDENNPVNIFFNEHIEISLGSELEKGDLFDKYKRWAENSKNYALSKARFGACLYKKFHKETPKDTSNINTHKRIWRNLRYVEIKGVQTVDKIDWAN